MNNLYMSTLQVVGGVLTPVLLLGLIMSINQSIGYAKDRVKYRTEKLKQNPPFTIELEEVPNKSMLEVKVYKNGELIFDTGVDKP